MTSRPLNTEGMPTQAALHCTEYNCTPLYPATDAVTRNVRSVSSQRLGAELQVCT